MGRADRARRERPSRLELRPRRPAGPDASSAPPPPSFARHLVRGLRPAPPEASPPAPGGVPSCQTAVPGVGRRAASRGARLLRLTVAAFVLLALGGLAAERPASAQTVATMVPSDWPLIPSGIAPGDKFRLIFASSTKRNATSTSIGDYNTFVQNRANAGHSAIQAYKNGFRVVGCTEDTDANVNTSTTYTAMDKGVPIYWLGGNKVADDYEDFYDESWDDEANPKDESGNSRNLTSTGNRPFTGCDHDGTADFLDYFGTILNYTLGAADVTTAGPGATARPGLPESGPIWSDDAVAKSQTRPFYGLSEVFLVQDTVAPTVTSIERESPATSPTNADMLTWRVTFSENVSNVDATDFEVDGTSAALTVSTVTEFTVYDVMASGGDLAGLNATVTLTFASDQNIVDASNNALTTTAPTGTNDATYDVDNTAPAFGSAEVDGRALVVTLSERLAAAANLANSAFEVKRTPAGGAEEPVALRPASPPSISGATVTLTLATAVSSTDTDVKVKYTKPTTDNDNRLKDAAGNETASFTDETVTNNTHDTDDTTAPTGGPATTVPGDWPLTPSGLSSGDKFRLLFATSTTRDANPTDIGTYNTFVQNRANAGHSAIRAYKNGFRVVGCTADDDANINTSTTFTTMDKGVPIYWLDGNKVADDYEDFYDESWDDEANPKDEWGRSRQLNSSGNRPYTGCDHDGTESFSGSNSRALGSSNARQGHPGNSQSGAGPINGGLTINSAQSRPFYGLSEVFQVPNAPTVAYPIPDQGATAGGWFSYTFPADTFEHPDGVRLSYTASYTSTGLGMPPEWLDFDPSTRTFSGKAWPNGHLRVTVTATDPGVGSVSDKFDIVVGAPTPLTPGALVSNMKEAVVHLNDQIHFVGAIVAPGDTEAAFTPREHAQRFRTGSLDNERGFAISELKIHFARPSDGDIANHLKEYTDGLTVSVYDVSNDKPGTEIFVFRPPYPLRDGVKTFTAPADAPALKRNTDFFIVFEATGPFASNSYIAMYTTDSDDEDGLTGWHIGNTRLRRSSGEDWDTSTANSHSDVIKMALIGTEVEVVLDFHDASLSELTLSDAGGGGFERTLAGSDLDADPVVRVSVPYDTTELTVTPTTSHDGARVERYSNSLNQDIPDADPFFEPGQQVPLAVGQNRINIWVRAQDGQTTRTYSVVVTREEPGMSAQAAALKVEFLDAPATHIGAGATFTLQVLFSEPVANSADDLKDHAIAVTRGSVQNVAAVPGRTDLWNLTIAPDGDGDVTVKVEAGGACGDDGVVCTGDGTVLGEGDSVTIEGPQATVRSPAPVALTAQFKNAPASHNGADRFNVQIVFSEAPHERGNRDILAALVVDGGTKVKMRRVRKDKAHRRVTIEPDGDGAVTLKLTPSADCAAANALCTAAGGKLEKEVTVTIPGPVAISVADARIEEADGAQLAFEVTLDRARHATVTVDYATEDGTAKVDENDYIATSGTLTFAAGETSKTVEVEVLDDAYDESEETMVLRLSNPVGARIADGEATGTIENTDLMPRAWLSRFGRTVADQVLDAVEGRMRAPRTVGAQASLAGQRLGLGPLFGADAAPEGGEAAASLRAHEAEAEEAGRRLAAWLAGESEAERSGPETRAATPRELLLGSSFSLTAGAADGAGGSASLWGGAAVSRFDGREGELVLDGEVASGLLGADWARGRWTAGLIVSHSRGEGGWRGEAGSGTVSSTLTGLYPWGRHALTERVSVWGVAGWGEGTLTLTPEGPDGESLAAIRTDLDLAMGAVGVRGTVVEAPPEGGVELSVTGDALGVRTTSAKVRGLAASEADVTRLRLGLEGSWKGLAVGTGTLEPRLELGARHDGGDAETGAGLDVGGGLAWSDPGRGTSAELRGRGLLTHESAGFGDRGFAGSLAFDPAPGSDRGPSLTLSQTVGAQASGGMDALLRPETARALGAADEDDLSRRRLEARLGYGFAVFGGGWTGTPELGLGWSEAVRETTVRWRLAEVRSAGLVFGLDVEGARREGVSGGAAPEHRLGLGLGWRLAGARRGDFEVRFEGARREPGDEAPGHEVGLRLTARW